MCICAETGKDGTKEHTEEEVELKFIYANRKIISCTNHLQNYLRSGLYKKIVAEK